MSLNIIEIEQPLEFIIPCEFSSINQNISALVFEIFILELLSQVENKPHCLVHVTSAD
jgi:hypothetical protein